jgi:hypothetical protein
MSKSILNTWLFEGGPLDNMRLSVQEWQTVFTCIKVAEGLEIKHFYEWHNGKS